LLLMQLWVPPAAAASSSVNTSCVLLLDVVPAAARVPGLRLLRLSAMGHTV
jgi:hypothetical protein